MPVDYSKFRPEQIEAAKLLASREATGEKLTVADIARRVGVDERTIYRWKNTDEFVELVNDISDRYMNMFLSECYEILRQRIRQGNVKAIELYLRRMGKLIDRKEVSGDVKMEVKSTESKSNEELLREAEQLERELLGGSDDTK